MLFRRLREFLTGGNSSPDDGAKLKKKRARSRAAASVSKDPATRAERRMKRRLKRIKIARKDRKARAARREEQAAATGGFLCRETPGYDIELRETGSKELVVMFSPGQTFSLYRHDFGRDVLFVSDLDHAYYLGRAVDLAQSISEAIEHNDYERVIFAGFSKGGFGALSLSRICAALLPERTLHAVAFSPQVRLYPKNPNLYFWSYGVLWDDAEKRPSLAAALEKFGDVSRVGELPNLCATIIHARRSEPDRIEASHIVGPNAAIRLVEGMFHGAKFYFMAQGVDRERLTNRIAKIYSNAEDNDLMQTKPENIGDLVEEIMVAAEREPDLNTLFGEVMERRPVATEPSPELAAFIADVRRAASSAS